VALVDTQTAVQTEGQIAGKSVGQSVAKAQGQAARQATSRVAGRESGEAAGEAAGQTAAQTAAQAATPAEMTTAALYPFTAHEGELLSAALAGYLAGQGWDLAWNAPQDYVVQRSYTVDAALGGLRPMLLRVLAPFGLSAVLHHASAQRVVDITAADPGRNAP